MLFSQKPQNHSFAFSLKAGPLGFYALLVALVLLLDRLFGPAVS